MFDERDPKRPMSDDRIPAAVAGILNSFGIPVSELPFTDLAPGVANRIASRIRASTGLPFVSVELHPYRSVPFVINALRYRAHVLGIEKILAGQTPVYETGLRPGSFIGDYEVSGFFGHAGLSAVYQAKERSSNEEVLLAAPLSSSSPQRLSERIPRGFHGYVPAGGVVAGLVSSSMQDANVHGYAGTIHAVQELERLRYQSSCKGLSMFHLSESGGGVQALVFRTGPVYSLRHHLQLQIGFNLSVFSQLAARCQDVGGHGNLSPESILLADGSLKAVINPSVDLFEGHFFTSCWEYNPLRRRGAAADVFAIGVMLYENFTGKRPFEAPFVPRLADDVREFELGAYMDFPNPSVASPLLNPKLESIILRCLRDSSYDLKQLGSELDSYIKTFGQDTKRT